ncbi:acetoacetate decarboxylase family protein [Saccharothrix australiensis]|uniref:Acetoacetate decarboxylase n=1 Tax=Saccharothrix australiensis TaxID=2072 RepID=A0A495VYS0_9PSEU|nr:acetoacetate decarboxylase family protein [Saccharothrix australiensis]RKT54399.1 acetoacetate decarboxylase [Saccharothrix australiensis]
MHQEAHPPEPWDLRGDGWVSAWLVRSSALPALPAPTRPLTLLGVALVCTAFADYRPGGVLAYHELVAVVPVRRGARIGLSITHAWVDSAASRAGGRALWGIPKEAARFEVDPRGSASAHDGRRAVASVRLGGPVRWRLPVRARASVWQGVPGGVARTPLRYRGGVGFARLSWRVDPAGPLGWLRAARPLFGLALTDFRLRFGPRRSRSSRG